MRKTFSFVMIVVMAMGLLLSACGTSAAQAPAQSDQSEAAQTAAAAESLTLKGLVHQNPPMVDFMTKFNDAFTARHPNINIDMAVVNTNDLRTVTQTRLTANDVDVVDMFGFANAAQPYMKSVDPPNW